jgi:hypothetical protein
LRVILTGKRNTQAANTANHSIDIVSYTCLIIVPLPAPEPRTEVADLETNGSDVEQATQIENPPSIREVIDEGIDAYKKDQNKYTYLGTCKYPMALT